MSLNKVLLIGTLGKDPETRSMPDGGSVVNLSVATSEKWKDKISGEKKEATEWHRVVIFGRLAEICSQYLRKGSRAYFEGSLRTKSYEKDGIKRYSTEVIVREMKLLDSKNQQQQSQSGGYQPPAQQQQAQPQQSYQPAALAQNANPPDDFVDDIPF